MDKYLRGSQDKEGSAINSAVTNSNDGPLEDKLQIDEIKEIKGKRVGDDNIVQYLVVLQAGDEEVWLPQSLLDDDITNLVTAKSKPLNEIVLGENDVDVLTLSKETLHKDNTDKVRKRKRSVDAHALTQTAGTIQKSTKFRTFSEWMETEVGKNGQSASKKTGKARQMPVKVGKKILRLVLYEDVERRMRRHFESRLVKLFPKVNIVNTVDGSTPPLDFHFITEYILRDGVRKMGIESMAGCGCDSEGGCDTVTCTCIEQMNEENRAISYEATADGEAILREDHMSTRDAIFECNKHCNCQDNCLNKLVQWGRTVPLEIFKTKNRGWGLRCPVDLKKGQFIDTYKGEIITNEEATKREASKVKKAGKAKDSYLYTMEKFAEDNGIPRNELYIVDGEFYGGPSRFINHSCEPNLRQFSVSYHHSDAKIYDLAFFAVEDIPADTELTFNYTDDDHGSRKKGKKGECLCGSANCRGYIWP